MRKSEGTRLNAVEKDGYITITSRDGKFKASYYKPAGQPQLILLERSKTDDASKAKAMTGTKTQRARSRTPETFVQAVITAHPSVQPSAPPNPHPTIP